ncbi:MAG: hypothetical protein FWG59_06465 [Betaproteobacteria bacterium]|nr:hypothetical protein [Betaproteobacteria bacterium]
MLAQKRPDGTSRLDWMDDNSKRMHGKPRSMYYNRLEQLEKTYSENRFRNLAADSLLYDYGKLVRWYDPLSSFWSEDAAMDDKSAAFHIWKATHLFFMAQYELALCGFHDAFVKTQDKEGKEYLMLGMARCFLAMSDAEACVKTLKAAVKADSQAVRVAAVQLMERALSL